MKIAPYYRQIKMINQEMRDCYLIFSEFQDCSADISSLWYLCGRCIVTKVNVLKGDLCYIMVTLRIVWRIQEPVKSQ